MQENSISVFLPKQLIQYSQMTYFAYLLNKHLLYYVHTSAHNMIVTKTDKYI